VGWWFRYTVLVLETAFAFRTISTVVAHFLHTEGVTSSNLVSSIPTKTTISAIFKAP
jgi:hypothetical protein